MIWYVDAPQELSPAATATMDFKAMVLTRVEQELDELDPMIIATSLDRTISDALASIPRVIVPDMPDRIIPATALRLGCRWSHAIQRYAR
ncbi:MAG TPA: hypothetical protein VGO68_13955 [Pyrinomonadaceae bacterium]|jgi:hypothetical protein|nr:hypothetical protein [Pyrinomonadaceae bacterium]